MTKLPSLFLQKKISSRKIMAAIIKPRRDGRSEGGRGHIVVTKEVSEQLTLSSGRVALCN